MFLKNAIRTGLFLVPSALLLAQAQSPAQAGKKALDLLLAVDDGHEIAADRGRELVESSVPRPPVSQHRRPGFRRGGEGARGQEDRLDHGVTRQLASA